MQRVVVCDDVIDQRRGDVMNTWRLVQTVLDRTYLSRRGLRHIAGCKQLTMHFYIAVLADRTAARKSYMSHIRFIQGYIGPSGVTGALPELGWNRVGVISTKTCNRLSLKRCKIVPRLLWWTNRKSHARLRFDWYQNKWPWMTLNGRNELLWNKIVLRSPAKNLNEDRPLLSAAKCRQWF